MRRYRWVVLFAMVGLLAGCATKQDFQRLESKVDQLIQATNRSTLDDIFGEQASQISLLVDQLDSKQKLSFENLQQEYASGALAVEDVREKMLGILGNNDRVVSTQRGIYVRNTQGIKLKAIPIDTKINGCQLVARENIPPSISQKQVLNRFSWGRGDLNGETILFPWELTISSFTKEVAEHTARRTAQEFIRMGGDKQWQRPIKIQISTEKDDQVKITTNEEQNEVYFEYENVKPETVDSETVDTAATDAGPADLPPASGDGTEPKSP